MQFYMKMQSLENEIKAMRTAYILLRNTVDAAVIELEEGNPDEALGILKQLEE